MTGRFSATTIDVDTDGDPGGPVARRRAQVGLPIGVHLSATDGQSLPPERWISRGIFCCRSWSAVWLPAIYATRDAVVAAFRAYMLAARARGVGPDALPVHAFAGAQSSQRLFGFSVSALVGASLLVEIVMSWPGIGQLTCDAVLKRDIFLVVDLVQLSGAVLLRAISLVTCFFMQSTENHGMRGLRFAAWTVLALIGLVAMCPDFLSPSSLTATP